MATTWASAPTAFAWSMNGQRRQLTKSQLINIGMKMVPALREEARKRQGKRTDLNITALVPESLKGEATEIAAKLVGASSTSVKHAKFVAENDPELATCRPFAQPV